MSRILIFGPKIRNVQTLAPKKAISYRMPPPYSSIGTEKYKVQSAGSENTVNTWLSSVFPFFFLGFIGFPRLFVGFPKFS